MSSKCLEPWEAKEPPIQQSTTWIKSMNLPVKYSTWKSDLTRGTSAEGKMHNSPHMSKDSWNLSTTRHPKAVDFQGCTNADIDLYMRMPTHLPPVDPKGEILLQLSKEEDAILEPTIPAIDNWSPHWDE